MQILGGCVAVAGPRSARGELLRSSGDATVSTSLRERVLLLLLLLLLLLARNLIGRRPVDGGDAPLDQTTVPLPAGFVQVIVDDPAGPVTHGVRIHHGIATASELLTSAFYKKTHPPKKYTNSIGVYI